MEFNINEKEQESKKLQDIGIYMDGVDEYYEDENKKKLKEKEREETEWKENKLRDVSANLERYTIIFL